MQYLASRKYLYFLKVENISNCNKAEYITDDGSKRGIFPGALASNALINNVSGSRIEELKCLKDQPGVGLLKHFLGRYITFRKHDKAGQHILDL